MSVKASKCQLHSCLFGGIECIPRLYFLFQWIWCFSNYSGISSLTSCWTYNAWII